MACQKRQKKKISFLYLYNNVKYNNQREKQRIKYQTVKINYKLNYNLKKNLKFIIPDYYYLKYLINSK